MPALFILASSWSSAQMRPGTLSSNIDFDTLARNEIHTWISNVGNMSHDPRTDGNSFEWPGGSGRTYMYQDGFCIAGRMHGSGDLRADGTYCTVSWQPGMILDDGTAADPADGNNRLYRVRRLTPAVYNSLPLQDQTVLRQDYEQWPVFQGAPWSDADGNGRYEPDFSRWLQDSFSVDGPSFLGDEMIWGAMNDLDSLQTHSLFGTIPIGLEVNTAVWAYDLPDCRSRAVFTRHRIIHKGIDALDSAYFAIWSDPDVGSGLDDFVGIDTVLQLAYAFNGGETDPLHGNIGALGYLLLQGPAVLAPGKTARRCGRTESDMKNLRFTAFTMYANGVLPYRDPDRRVARGAQMLYNNMKGLFSYGAAFVDPHTGDTTTLMIAGDPGMRTGWLDSDNLPPGDRRLLASSGPFDLAVGDTQEVIYARIVAEGGSPAGDLIALRETADCIIRTYRDTPLRAGSIPQAINFSIDAPFPNPFHTDIHTHLGLVVRSEHLRPISIQLINALGQSITRLEFIPRSERETFRFPLSPAIPAGVYHIIASNGTRIATRQIVLFR
jgi:hypothetical protein